MSARIPAAGRIIGVDLGAVRIGVAISDSDQTMASGLRVLPRTGDLTADRRALAQIVADEAAVGIIVGLPVSLDGTAGPAARAALAEVDALQAVLGSVAVETTDERFTTVSAQRELRASGRRGKQARARVDQVAAAVLLQSWLDRRRSVAAEPAQ